MLYCRSCHMNITGAPERCPLCQGELIGEPDPEGGLFIPLPSRKKEAGAFFRVLTMSALFIIICGLAANYLISGEFTWSLFITGGTACGWVFAVIGWRKRRELAKNILWQTVIVSVAGILWDICTGWNGWSLDFIIPCASVAAVLALSVLALILRMESSDYMVYLLTVALYGLIPIIFLFTNTVAVRYPSVICVALCALTLIALLLFFRKNAIDELQKKFHI